jgi:hypothetical protein
MKTEQEVKELCDKKEQETEYSPLCEILDVSVERMKKITIELDQKMCNYTILESMAWVFNNPNFTDDEKLLLSIECGARFGIFIHLNYPESVKRTKCPPIL